MIHLIRIEAPHFTAGATVERNILVICAPIIKYMSGWTVNKAVNYCNQKGWSYKFFEN